jgi:hypothetical protein
MIDTHRSISCSIIRTNHWMWHGQFRKDQCQAAALVLHQNVRQDHQ